MSGIARALALLAVAGCGEARTVESSTPKCTSWKPEVAQTFATNCASCHSGENPAGGYDVTTYAGAIAEPGRSALDTVLDPATADAVHQPFTELDPLVSSWAGECNVSYVHSSIHPGGIQDPMSDDFHGKEVERQGFQLQTCASCHGSDFTGGIAGSDCTSCHTEPGGPAACNTCHAIPPASGAHVAHATSPRLNKKQDCVSCHVVPDVYTAAGHVTTASGEVDEAPAEVTFGMLAQTTLQAADRKGPASFDPSSLTCANVHCHGDTLGDASARVTRPSWNGGPTQADCGSCHGAPPTAGHPPDTECARCHIAAHPAAHINGALEVGNPALGCNGCHGNPERPLSGAHKSHIEGTHDLAEPLACSDCHVVPSQVGAAGHIDSAAPAEVTFGELATAEQANPTLADSTCSGTYCHGGGSRLAGDTAPSRLDSVAWTATGGQAVCGTCHGVPPVDDAHTRDLGLTDCATCHAATVDDFGNIRFSNGVTTHINGRPDVAAP